MHRNRSSIAARISSWTASFTRWTHSCSRTQGGVRALSTDGFRVLAVAYKRLRNKPTYTKEDEYDLILKGYVAFLDPPKETAAPAIAALQATRRRRQSAHR